MRLRGRPLPLQLEGRKLGCCLSYGLEIEPEAHPGLWGALSSDLKAAPLKGGRLATALVRLLQGGVDVKAHAAPALHGRPLLPAPGDEDGAQQNPLVPLLPHRDRGITTAGHKAVRSPDLEETGAPLQLRGAKGAIRTTPNEKIAQGTLAESQELLKKSMVPFKRLRSLTSRLSGAARGAPHIRSSAAHKGQTSGHGLLHLHRARGTGAPPGSQVLEHDENRLPPRRAAGGDRGRPSSVFDASLWGLTILYNSAGKALEGLESPVTEAKDGTPSASARGTRRHRPRRKPRLSSSTFDSERRGSEGGSCSGPRSRAAQPPSLWQKLAVQAQP